MSKYKSYHTILKTLSQRASLPNTYIEEINRSTIWRWKQEDANKYTGHELSKLEVLENFIKREEAQSIMSSYLKVALSISSVVTTCKSFQLSLKANKADLVKTILRYKSIINQKLLLRVLNIPISVFYYWKNKVLFKCENSSIQLCKRIYPNQLSKKEVSVMKELLLSEKFTYWPVCSIAFYALRQNILSISLATWYKYIKSLGINRPKIIKKKKYSTSIIACAPNEYWHADITIVKSLDGIKNYVYLLMDNYSKYIINWKVEPVISGKIRVQTIKDAYNLLITKNREIKLIIDGGPENNNMEMDKYTHSEDVNIIKLIALKDVPFSNSVVEAQNKLLKYHYLFKQQFYDINELRNKLNWIVDDYNNNRPHISLNGLTPYESYSGISIDKNQILEQFNQAKKERLIQNRKEICIICK